MSRTIRWKIGDRFGKLTVIGRSSRPNYAVCRCDCGNTVEVRANSLTKTKSPTKSCGCIQREIASEIGKKVVAKNSARQIAGNVRYNTNFQVIENSHPPKNNRSGHKGVWWNASRGKWEAYLAVHGKRVHLGRYGTYEEAVKARERGEEEYYLPIIEQKHADEDR